MGKGAFMKTEENAIALARNLVTVGEMFNKPTIGLLTNMNTPLGKAIGNWLEVNESIDCLMNKGPADLMELTNALAGVMIMLGGKASSIEEGLSLSKKMIGSGKAFEKFLEIVKKQGGDVKFIEEPEKYRKAKHIIPVLAEKKGYIVDYDALEFGMTSVSLGAGRLKADDPVDFQAGIILHKQINHPVDKGEVIAELHTNLDSNHQDYVTRISKACSISSEPISHQPMIFKKISNDGIEPWK